jgi:MATE family multidrug resistance protein
MDEQQKRSWLPKAFRRRQLSLEPTDSPSERTSLLQPQPAANSHDSDATEQAVKQPRWSWWHQVAIDVGLLLKNSAPVIAAYALQNSLQTASVMVVGQRSPRDLATAAFAYMFAMSTAWLIALGGTTAIDTLGSTAFTGSKNPHDLGIILQRAFFVLTLFYMPVSVLWFFSEPVFRLLGQEAQLSHDSAVFLRCLIPGGLGYVFFEAMKKYLQAQGRSAFTSLFALGPQTCQKVPAPWRLWLLSGWWLLSAIATPANAQG